MQLILTRAPLDRNKREPTGRNTGRGANQARIPLLKSVGLFLAGALNMHIRALCNRWAIGTLHTSRLPRIFIFPVRDKHRSELLYISKQEHFIKELDFKEGNSSIWIISINPLSYQALG